MDLSAASGSNPKQTTNDSHDRGVFRLKFVYVHLLICKNNKNWKEKKKEAMVVPNKKHNLE